MKNIVLFFLLFFSAKAVLSQQITYTQPESEDVRSLDFEIIGKIRNNYIVYKNIRNKYALSVYDNSMKLKQRVDLDFMPDKTLNVDFVAYPDFAYLIYQYQKRSTLYCMAAKIDGEGTVEAPYIEGPKGKLYPGFRSDIPDLEKKLAAFPDPDRTPLARRCPFLDGPARVCVRGPR